MEKMEKLVVIDYLNLFYMHAALGVYGYDFKMFYQFLVNEVGDVHDPKQTDAVFVGPADKFLRTKNTLEAVGFRIEEATNLESQDDGKIQKIIEESPQTVKEIVLVSSDQGYVSCLRKKAEQGIKVYWVATLKEDPKSGKKMVGENLEALFKEGLFNFVELADFTQRPGYMRTPWVPKEKDIAPQPPEQETLSKKENGAEGENKKAQRALLITLKMTAPEKEINAFARLILSIALDHPDLEVDLKLLSIFKKS